MPGVCVCVCLFIGMCHKSHLNGEASSTTKITTNALTAATTLQNININSASSQRENNNNNNIIKNQPNTRRWLRW